MSTVLTAQQVLDLLRTRFPGEEGSILYRIGVQSALLRTQLAAGGGQIIGVTPPSGYTATTLDPLLAQIAAGASGITDGDKGDIVVSGNGAAWTIDAGAVNTAKLGGDITTAGRALLDDADAAAQRATLGLGTAATQNTGTSGATVPLLNGANTWSGTNAFAGNVRIGSTAVPTVALDVTGAGAFTGNLTASGLVAFGTSTTTGVNFRLGGNITGAGTARAQQNNVTVQSDVTGSARVFESNVTTQATTFTLGELIHYQSAQAAFGAGSTVTNQNGFVASSSLVGATNNYGFRGLIQAGTGRWNFYADGTADNYMAGSLGIGGTGNLGIINLNVVKNISGATTAYGVNVGSTIQSDVTSQGIGYHTIIGTAAAAFTLNSIIHYTATQGTIGAGSSVNSQSGFVANSTLVGATNNYGFRGQIAAGTGRWNFFADGTANNAFAGNVRIGSTAAPTVALDVTGSAAISGSLTIGGFDVRSIPQNSRSLDYTLALSDLGGHVLHPSADTTARTITVPANASVAFPIGTAITIVNQNGAGTLTIAITTDTMRLAGAGTTGSRTLAANGIATLLKITSTEWIISGTGLT